MGQPLDRNAGGNLWLQSPYFWPVLQNTLAIGIYSLIVGTGAAILLALALNEVKHRWFKSAVQTITYIPYFISVVVLVGMMQILLGKRQSLVAPVRCGRCAPGRPTCSATQMPSLPCSYGRACGRPPAMPR